MLLAATWLAVAQAPAAHAYGITLGSFEIDGNLVDDSGPGEPIDWTDSSKPPKILPPNYNPFTDLSGKNDDGFGNGSKETDPANWSCIKQSAPGKDDILSGAVAFRTLSTSAGPKQFAYVHYFRKAVNGDAHIDYEFNRSTMPNPACPSTPARSDKDFVITFDTEQGGKFIFVKLAQWNAATSSFTTIDTTGKADGAVNIPANGGLSIPGHADGDFGEAVINLTDTIGTVSCGQVSTAYMKSRSSTSIESALQDRTATKPVQVASCPNSTLSKGVRNETTSPGGAFAPTATAKPGDTLTYQLTYKNTGTAPATNVVVKDTLDPRQTPTSATLAACTGTCSYDAATKTFTWTFPSVAVNGTQTMLFSVTLSSAFPSGDSHVKNVSTVKTTEEGEPPRTSNETDVTVKAAPKSVPGKKQRNVTTDNPPGSGTYTAGNISASPGDTLEYQLTYTNGGTATATTATITDTIPAKATYVANSCAPACETTGSPVTSVKWTFTDVAPGETKTVTFQVLLSGPFTAGTSTAVTNTAVTCATGEPLPCPTSPPVTTDVKSPNSSTAKTVSVNGGAFTAGTTTAKPGDTLTYKVVYTNAGPGIAHDVVVTDAIPAKSTYVADSCTGCSPNGPPVTSVAAPKADVASGGNITFTFSVKLDSAFPSGTTPVKNVAVFTTKEEGTKPSNEVTVNVTAAPKSSGTKGQRNVTTDTPAGAGNYTTANISASPGDTVGYQLTYTNAGNATAATATITDTIPTGASYVAGSCSPACETTGTPVTSVKWTFTDVAPGETKTVTFQVLLSGPFAAGTNTAVTNTAVTCATGEPLPCPTTPPVTTEVKSPMSSTDKKVRVLPSGTLSAGPVNAEPGNSLEYQLVYTNAGPGIAHNVTLTEPIPNNSTYVSCTEGCTPTGDPVVTSIGWSFGDVPSGGTRTVTFTVKLDPSFPSGTTNVTNTAVSNTKEEGDKNSNTVIVKVTAAPKLALVKTVDENPHTGRAVPGDELTYGLAYSNTGGSPAASTTITETVPSGTTFSSCSDNCTVSGSTVTWTIGSVPAGGSGKVTMTVTVNNDVGCAVCNTAQISSPSQANGAAIMSNQVCLVGTPGPNPAGARANGTGEALGIVGVNPLNLGILPDIHAATSTSSQSGPGTDGRNATAIPVNAAPVATVDLLNSSASSSVGSTPARARQLTTASAAEVNLLAGLVTASAVRTSSEATATGDASSYSAAGTTTGRVNVAGVAYDNAPPNTRITIPAGNLALALVGVKDVSVTINEQIGTTSRPAVGQLSGGTYASDLTVYGIHVHIGDSNLLKGGSQPGDIYVAKSVAHADFPQTKLCSTDGKARSVSGHAFIASAKVDPDLAEVVHGYTGIPASGGSDFQSLDNLFVDDTGGLVSAGLAESSTTGTVTTLASTSTSYAKAADVCINLPGVAGCAITAQAVRSQSNSSANGTTATSDDTGTQLVNVKVGLLPAIAGTPPKNTTLLIPGIAKVVLNEQVADAPETGHSGLTVRAIHVTLLGSLSGLPLGAEVIVAEAHSDAKVQ